MPLQNDVIVTRNTELPVEQIEVEAEEARVRAHYDRRDASGKRTLYAWFHPDVLSRQHRFELAAAWCLRRAGWEDLSRLRALDVGCGNGVWLQQLMTWGAQAENLHGVDLLPDRIAAARCLAPHIDYRQGSGWQLPFEDGSMDLVSAHTVFSSILNAEARAGLAREMSRVMAPRGCILIHDFRVRHPLNPDTTAIRRSEIRRLFPKFKLYSRSVTLAPPIARRLAPAALWLAEVVEALCPLLRTHNMNLLCRPSMRQEK
jgi:SAM-dependent methyltransferase